MVALVPIKDFRHAKHRLADRLGSDEREQLARQMAATVLRAAGGLDVRVVCSDEEVAAFARDQGAGVVWVDAEGLNPAITEAVASVALDVDHVLISHGDLPHARSFDDIVVPGAVSIVPDRHHDGTNVLAFPAECGFRFSYGVGSLAAHTAEALRLGLDVHLRQIPELQWDVDVPADLDEAPGGN